MSSPWYQSPLAVGIIAAVIGSAAVVFQTCYRKSPPEPVAAELSPAQKATGDDEHDNLVRTILESAPRGSVVIIVIPEGEPEDAAKALAEELEEEKVNVAGITAPEPLLLEGISPDVTHVVTLGSLEHGTAVAGVIEAGMFDAGFYDEGFIDGGWGVANDTAATAENGGVQ